MTIASTSSQLLVAFFVGFEILIFFDISTTSSYSKKIVSARRHLSGNQWCMVLDNDFWETKENASRDEAWSWSKNIFLFQSFTLSPVQRPIQMKHAAICEQTYD